MLPGEGIALHQNVGILIVSHYWHTVQHKWARKFFHEDQVDQVDKLHQTDESVRWAVTNEGKKTPGDKNSLCGYIHLRT